MLKLVDESKSYYGYSYNNENFNIKSESYYYSNNNQNNYSESSDTHSNASHSPLANNMYDFYDTNNNFNEYDDYDMEEKPKVNRGGRKQVKVGTTKRNARERNRVRYINSCFEVLRDHIPFEFVNENKHRKLSKVETLKYAALYIKQLTEILNEADESNYEAELVQPSSKRHRAANLDTEEQKQNSNNGYSNIINNSSSISINNININIYDNRSVNDLYSPASSNSSSSSYSSSSSFNNFVSSPVNYLNSNKCSSPQQTSSTIMHKSNLMNSNYPISYVEYNQYQGVNLDETNNYYQHPHHHQQQQQHMHHLNNNNSHFHNQYTFNN